MTTQCPTPTDDVPANDFEWITEDDLEPAEDDGVVRGDDPSEANHSRLEGRLNDLVEAVHEAAGGYWIEIDVEYDDGRLTSATIRSDEHWTNEGETGLMSALLVFGPRGGIRRADIRDDFTGFELDRGPSYQRKNSARIQWRRIKEDIRQFD